DVCVVEALPHSQPAAVSSSGETMRDPAPSPTSADHLRLHGDTPMPSFLDLGVPAVLADVLAADGKTDAFAIQRDTLPDSLAGRDVLGRGRTGSGKTIAFALPLVARLSASVAKTRPAHPRGLVLAPTRELASQIAATVAPLAAAAGMRVTT